MTIKKNMQAEQRKAILATRGQPEEVTSGSYTEERIPKLTRKRKKGTKQPAALAATIELHDGKEGGNAESVQESSDIMEEQSDTDDETIETNTTVIE